MQQALWIDCWNQLTYVFLTYYPHWVFSYCLQRCFYGMFYSFFKKIRFSQAFSQLLCCLGNCSSSVLNSSIICLLPPPAGKKAALLFCYSAVWRRPVLLFRLITTVCDRGRESERDSLPLSTSYFHLPPFYPHTLNRTKNGGLRRPTSPAVCTP